MKLLSCKETKNTVSIELLKISTRYLDEFVNLKCAPDLLALRIFPNAKEITESMAVYNGVRRSLGDVSLLGNKDVSCWVLGDGVCPRTGVLFAFRTRWQVYSIDPRLRYWVKPVGRLTILQQRAETVTLFPVSQLNVVVATHSHANWGSFWLRVPAPKLGVALECCVPQKVEGVKPVLSYEDGRVFSLERLIKVWKE